MALFDNVTYTYYTDTLGRSEVPDEATFNKYKTEVVLYVRSLYNDGLILPRYENGIDEACCMMIETDYLAARAASGADNVDTSETIGGYSHSMSAKASEIAVEKNAKSADESRYKWLELYCHVMVGVL